MLESLIRGLVRRGSRPNYADGAREAPGLTPGGDLLVAAGLPPLAALVALGDSFWARTSTAAAPVTAIPTTAALIGLWNGEPEGGKSYVIDSVFAVIVAATAAVQATGILANVSTFAVATALADVITPRGLRANQRYRGAARLDVGITLDATSGVAANWQPLGPSGTPVNTTQVGQVLEYDVRGLIVLPPKGQLALTVLSGAATATSVQVGMRWHEVQLPTV